MENEWKAEQVSKQLEDIGAKVFFEKQLTSSDVSASGRVVVPKVCKVSTNRFGRWLSLEFALVPAAIALVPCGQGRL